MEVSRLEALHAQGRFVARALRLQRLQPRLLGAKIAGPGRPPAVYAGRDRQGRRVEFLLAMLVASTAFLEDFPEKF